MGPGPARLGLDFSQQAGLAALLLVIHRPPRCFMPPIFTAQADQSHLNKHGRCGMTAEVLEATDAALSANAASQLGPFGRFGLIYSTVIASNKGVLAGNQHIWIFFFPPTPAQSCGGVAVMAAIQPKHGVTHLISMLKPFA